MSFLNPSVLFALSAISIPIIIHLLNLRKIRKVEFSTLMFLKEIQKSKMRRIKLKQLLLLLFRILIIAFLVLSFSKPVYEGFAGSSSDGQKSTVLIFLDDSFSMSAAYKSGTYFSEANESVQKILNLYSKTDEIYFIPFSKIGLKGSKISYAFISEVIDSLRTCKISDKYTSISEIMNLSDEIISSSGNPVNNIYIISDFQKSNFTSQDQFAQKFESLSSGNVNLYLVNTGNRSVNNLSIDSFSVETKIPEKDKDVYVKIILNNFTQNKISNKNIQLYIENELTDSKVTDAEPFEKKEVELKFKPGKAGIIKGYAELVQDNFSEDELSQDNKYYFTVYIPDQFNITLISDNSSGYKFLDLAFKAANGILSDSSGMKNTIFNLRYGSTVNSDIKQSDIVVISGKKSFSENEAALLRDYVSNGGGLFLFTGKEIDITNYNSILLSKFNSVRIDRLNTDQENNQNLKFGKIDFEHPLMSEIYKNKSLNITSEKYIVESPQIKSYYELLPTEKTGNIILLSNGKIFLAETKFARGKIITASVPSDDGYSDFPFKSVFLPLLIRSVYYASGNFDYQKDYIVGMNNVVAVRGLKNVSDLILPGKIKASYSSEYFLPADGNNFLLIPYTSNTSMTGEYSIQDSTGNSSAFALNYNSLESETLKMENIELKNYFENKGLKNVTITESSGNFENNLKVSHQVLELWKYLLLAALLFVAAELILSKNIEQN